MRIVHTKILAHVKHPTCSFPQEQSDPLRPVALQLIHTNIVVYGLTVMVYGLTVVVYGLTVMVYGVMVED